MTLVRKKIAFIEKNYLFIKREEYFCSINCNFLIIKPTINAEIIVPSRTPSIVPIVSKDIRIAITTKVISKYNLIVPKLFAVFFDKALTTPFSRIINYFSF
ncbi:Uncharacterised protein [Staphylococcus gallinarum]|uniref:Uncharacterized protein n=1 Tax=Staphylococcus gallinarum TaxID=1293 RepID=A0A380FDF7_STAGA|nr:Uncharacterised protein [Staphylococcus gallinarum]